MEAPLRSLVAFIALLVTVWVPLVAAAVDPVVIQGNKFFYSTSLTQYLVRGVVYSLIQTNNQTGQRQAVGDVLSNNANCMRDARLLQGLTVNTVFVSGIDPANDHSACLQTFNDNNIYVMADLSNLAESYMFANWTTDLFHNYTTLIDELASYDNILGMYVAYDMVHQFVDTSVLPFIKAAFRDLHAYMRYNNYRDIPLGYASSNDFDAPDERRENLSDYLLCDADSPDDRPDFLGWTEYNWCSSDATYQSSGFADASAGWNYDLPKLFAEYPLSCNSTGGGDGSTDVSVVKEVYSTQVRANWTGGFLFQYFNDNSNHGLVNTLFASAAPAPPYSALSAAFATFNPNLATATPTSGPSSRSNLVPCPTATGTQLVAAPTVLPPQPFDELCECMARQVGCKWNGDGNATAEAISMCSTLSGNECAGIDTDIVNGQYGAYSVCNATAQEQFLVNRAWQVEGNSNPSSCSNYNGQLVSPSPASAQGYCADLLQQAGAAGTQTVSGTPAWLGGPTLAGYTAMDTGGSSGEQSSGSSSSSSGLSTGAQAGIGVAVAIICIALIVAGIFLLRRRQRRQRNAAEPNELYAPYQGKRHMIGGREKYELPGSNEKYEMGGDGAITEMEGKTEPEPEPVELSAEPDDSKVDDEIKTEKQPNGGPIHEEQEGSTLNTEHGQSIMGTNHDHSTMESAPDYSTLDVAPDHSTTTK